MRRKTALIMILFMAVSAFTACGDKISSSDPQAGGMVAGSDEMLAAENVVEEGITPIYGSSIKDGVYRIDAASSSSMFKITECILTVENGKMTAEMTMSAKGYLYIYMGTGEEAVSSDESRYISFAEKDGAHTFTVPVEALDMGIACAAFSKNKEKWYDRTLCFKADSLPLTAFADGTVTTAESLALTDGEYTVELTLEGGSGKSYVESPALLKVENGKAAAQLIWSSPYYDYMIVDGEKYLPLNTEGNSVFEIPVAAFDRKLSVIGNTTSMSTPHEIEYTLYFDSAEISEK